MRLHRSALIRSALHDKVVQMQRQLATSSAEHLVGPGSERCSSLARPGGALSLWAPRKGEQADSFRSTAELKPWPAR